MPRYQDGIPHAVTAFEAAGRHDAIRVTCDCGHYVVYDPHALWWLCERRGWSDNFRDLKKRFYCSVCRTVRRKKVRPQKIELTKDQHTVQLPMPNEREWRKAVRRVRS